MEGFSILFLVKIFFTYLHFKRLLHFLWLVMKNTITVATNEKLSWTVFVFLLSVPRLFQYFSYIIKISTMNTSWQVQSCVILMRL